MNTSLNIERHSSEVSWTSSALIHGILLLVFALQYTVPLPKPKILTIETVAGSVTPRGSGAGAPGDGSTITDAVPPSPLASAFAMNLADIKPITVPQKTDLAVKPKPATPPKTEPKPDIAGERKAFAFPDLRTEADPNQELVEGMGAGRQAGTSQGAPNIKGNYAGRGFRGPES